MRTFCLLCLFANLWPAVGQTPSTITYQGRLQAAGTNFAGNGHFKFALVSSGTNTSRPATATADLTAGFVTSIMVTDGGHGYLIAPLVTITDPTGAGAIAIAQISDGSVTNISVQSAGSGYASPVVTVASPPASYVYGTFWSNDGTSTAGGEPAGAVTLPVSEGLFTVLLGDAGLPNMTPIPADVFRNPTVHLRVWFSDTAQGFVQLAPDHPLSSVGYAMMAAQVTASGLPDDAVTTATLRNSAVTADKLSSNAVTTTALQDFAVTDRKLATNSVSTSALQNQAVTSDQLATNAVNSNHIQDGTIAVSDLNANLLTGTFWRLAGNSNTVAANFIGTTDNRPLELRVQGQRALLLEPATDAQFGLQPNVIGGLGSSIGSGAVGSTIGGGQGNAIHSRFSTIAGGFLNTIRSNSFDAAIGGGGSNQINTNSNQATIAGGTQNRVGGGSPFSTISGGQANDIGDESFNAVIGGGSQNDIGHRAEYSTIAGGANNDVAMNAPFATIPGGDSNFAVARAFAAGRRAKANHAGAFVWGDSQNADIASTNNNSVTMRAIGGYRLFSNLSLSAGVYMPPGGNSWTSVSDRNAKENFEPVNAQAVLEKVAALPLSTWNYKSQDTTVRHIGPMAQDFKGAFGVGETDTGIATIDADGVALAAIQGLNQKLHEALRRAEAENAALKQRLQAIEEIVLRIPPR